MSVDRELLELAAKAAGNPKIIFNGAIWCNCERMNAADARGNRYPSEWNPLTDDGDALRLAVELHIDIRHFMYGDGRMDCLVDRLGRGFSEKFTDDPAAATRRAIVRAAAEIGRVMP